MQKRDLLDYLEKLRAVCQETWAEYQFAELLETLAQERFDKVLPYHLEHLEARYAEIEQAKGHAQAEACRKLMVLECLCKSWDEIFSDKYPASIQEQFRKKAEKMFARAQSEEVGWPLQQGDKYWKDLALARQQMYPAAAQVVEVYSGFEVVPGLSHGLGQTMRFLKLLTVRGGSTGFYQIHTDSPDLEDFNEAGWNRCYLLVAEMLERHHEIKGMFGASWFYDPQLENISPRLMYLQTIPQAGGAQMFHLGADDTGNALAKSKTRLKLYEEGKYRPQKYMLVWPRKELIAWAETFSRLPKASR